MQSRVLPFAFFITASAALYAQELPEGGPTTGRVLWLRGDHCVKRGLSGLVNTWGDSSDAHNDLSNWTSVALPEWRAAAVNGLPALHFDGNDFLFGAGMPTGSYTQVVACQLDDLAAPNDVISNLSWHELYFGGSDRVRLFHGGDFVTSATGVETGMPIVLVATYDASTGAGALYQDGLLVGSGNDGRPRNADSAILLGSFAYESFLSGSIAEVMAYDHVLSATDLGNLHAYLMQRYHGAPSPIVQLDQLPRPGQILQRDDNDRAAVVFAGSVKSPQWSELTLTITCNGVPFDSSSQVLSFTRGSAPFNFTRTLLAGENDYELSLYAKRGAEQRLVARIDNVCVGDVWLISGQSNAVAADYHAEFRTNAECQTHWLRSFGTASIASDVSFDLHWDLADGESMYSHGSVGAWGLRLAAQLEQRYAMPIGLINGGVCGTSITTHRRDDANPRNLATTYGRLLARADAASVKDVVRGMLWYQGEADGDSASNWRNEWQSLCQSWQLDYPSMQQIYLFQIRDNCTGDGRQLREVQRELIDDSNNTYVMSTTAAPFHDGCHFQYLGYRELGDRLARVLARDFYGSSDTQEIDAPNIQRAAWIDSQHSRILLTFRDLDDRLIIDPGAELNFYADDEVAIQSATVSGNTIQLQLAASSNATSISYEGHAFDGPWLKNARGVGALTFFNVAIH